MMKIELMITKNSICLNKIVDAKMKSLHHEAARMFPYTKRSRSVNQDKIDKLVEKLDKQKNLHFLKGANAIQVVESSLNEAEKHDVKNSIMRKFKVEQLK